MVSYKVLLVAASIISFIALGTILTAVAVPAWSSISAEYTATRVIERQVYSGLWRTCSKEIVKETNEFSCVDVTYDDAMRAVTAMTMIGLFCTAGVTVLIILKCCLFENNKIFEIIIIIVSLCAVIFLVIGVAVFGSEVHTDPSHLHAGFGLSVVAAVLMLVVAILVVIMMFTGHKVPKVEIKPDD